MLVFCIFVQKYSYKNKNHSKNIAYPPKLRNKNDNR